MRGYWKILPAAGLCAGLGLSFALAQPPGRPPGPPGGPGDRKGPPPTDRDRRPGPKPDAQVDAWVKTLVDRITDPHDTIRASARAALVSVGQPALPALRKIADGDDGAKADAARRVIDAIERGPRRPGPGLPPPPPGGPGDGGPGDRPPPPPGDRRPGGGPPDEGPDGPPRPPGPGGGEDPVAAAGGGIQWFTSLAAGRAEAARLGRPILFVSAAPHCAGVSGTW